MGKPPALPVVFDWNLMLRYITLGLLCLGAAASGWAVLSRFSLARLEDVLVLPFWLIWFLIPYAYPALVLRRQQHPGPPAFSALMLALFSLAVLGEGGMGAASLAGANALVCIAACAVAMLAHWLACIVLRLPFALPWREQETDERHD
jgi:hypothetical protein